MTDPPSTVTCEAFIAGLPRAELHVHHVGSAPLRTVAELAERHAGSTTVPSDPTSSPTTSPSPTLLTSSPSTSAWSYWPIVGLPTPAYLPQYAVLFVAGLLAARSGWLNQLRTRLAWPAAGSALVGVLLVFASRTLTGAASAIAGGAGGALVAVGSAVLMIIVGQRVFRSEPGPLRRFLAANAFAVYLIHPVVLVGWAVALSGLTGLVLPSVVQAAILLALSLPTCWLLAAAIRRIPGVRRVL